jgi:hypothetical protein
LIFLLLLGFFLNLALVTITGVGISEAAFGKIAIAVMAFALPVLFGGMGLWLLPAIRKELLNGRPTNQRRAAEASPNQESLAEGSLPERLADRLDAISSVTEYTTAELKPRSPEQGPRTG